MRRPQPEVPSLQSTGLYGGSRALSPCLNKLSASWLEALLLVHEDRLHGMKHHRIQVFSAVRDADEGTSICRHCHHSFPTWNALRTHIEHASCSQFDPLQVMSTSLANARSSLLPQILEIDPAGLSLNPCVGDYLRSHCILCGTQLWRFQDMTHHFGLASYRIVPTLARVYAFTMYILPCGLRSYAPLQGTLPADGPPDRKHGHYRCLHLFQDCVPTSRHRVIPQV